MSNLYVIVHNAVRDAIKDGVLIRPDKCEACNRKRKVVAHHPDYLKPLEVEWVCRKCHCQIHLSGSGLNKPALPPPKFKLHLGSVEAIRARIYLNG